MDQEASPVPTVASADIRAIEEQVRHMLAEGWPFAKTVFPRSNTLLQQAAAMRDPLKSR
jgi:hypothetical protein